MRNFLVLATAAICLSAASSLFSDNPRQGDNSSQKGERPKEGRGERHDGDYDEYYDEEYEGDLIWIGPGWYYGNWFDTEGQYNEWRRNNPDHYNHNRDEDRDREGERDDRGDRGERGGHGGGGRR